MAERNAVLRAGLLQAELEYFKAPKFVEMDDEVVIQRSNEIAAVKSLYEKEINSRVQSCWSRRKSPAAATSRPSARCAMTRACVSIQSCLVVTCFAAGAPASWSSAPCAAQW